MLTYNYIELLEQSSKYPKLWDMASTNPEFIQFKKREANKVAIVYSGRGFANMEQHPAEYIKDIIARVLFYESKHDRDAVPKDFK